MARLLCSALLSWPLRVNQRSFASTSHAGTLNESVPVSFFLEIEWSDENERGGLYATYKLCMTGLDDLSQIPKA